MCIAISQELASLARAWDSPGQRRRITPGNHTRRSIRPSFAGAAEPRIGEALYDSVARLLRSKYELPVETGVFGARMQLSLVNNGPVTLIVQQGPQS